MIQLFQIIQNPKPRSARWICSSVPEDQWDTPLACYSSAEYHTNNLQSPVLFEQASKHIPKNAIVIEVAPHGLLQAILRRSLSPQCTNIALTQRAHPQGLHFFLSAIGRYVAIIKFSYLCNLSMDRHSISSYCENGQKLRPKSVPYRGFSLKSFLWCILLNFVQFLSI